MTPSFLQLNRAISELAPNPINPRILKEKAFKELQKSLEDDPHFFQARPLIVSMAEGRENTIIAGNQRLEAAKALGWATVPVIEVRGATLEEEKQWMVKDNLHKGEWDFEKLADGFDLAFLKEMGFDEKGLNKVLANVDNSADDEFDAEKEAEAIIEPVVQRGEIWQLGEHRLMCGDSTDGGDVALLMDGKKADMVFTDPPYELETKGGGLLKESAAMKGIRNLGIDKFDPSTLMPLAETSVFCCNKPLVPKYIELAEKWKVSWDLCVYHKQNVTPNYGGHLMTDLEYLLVIGKQAPITGTGQDKELYSKLYSGGKDADNKTAWSKPVALCEKFICLYTHAKELVMDIFLGSGSTLIACENTKRVCYGMELSEKYCDVIIKRWEEKTGKKAVKTQV